MFTVYSQRWGIGQKIFWGFSNSFGGDTQFVNNILISLWLKKNSYEDQYAKSKENKLKTPFEIVICNILWLCKILSLGEVGWSAQGNCIMFVTLMSQTVKQQQAIKMWKSYKNYLHSLF